MNKQKQFETQFFKYLDELAEEKEQERRNRLRELLEQVV